jgi:hypothetical protein
MSTGNLKRSSYTSFDLGQIRSDTNNLRLIQNGPTVVNYSDANGVTMTLTYYYYTWGNIKVRIIKMTNIFTPSGGPFKVTIAYNLNFTNCSVGVNANTVNAGPSIIIQTTITNLGTGVSFQITGGIGGPGITSKGCIIAIGI